MSAPSMLPEPLSELHVDKAKIDATLTLSNGTSVQGCFFISGNSATHAGPERIKDVVNAAPGFFPFQINMPDGTHQFILYNRDHVVLVALSGVDEVQSVPGYDVATRRTVSMLLSNRVRLRGTVSVYLPPERNRLSDFAHIPERFIYLVGSGVTFLVNATHVLELVEENPEP
jgi:hypothetical protein